MYQVQLRVCIKFGPLQCSIDKEISGEKIPDENSSSASVCLFVGTLLAG
jgi:hypothetical protein